jgi:hypothetical protein
MLSDLELQASEYCLMKSEHFIIFVSERKRSNVGELIVITFLHILGRE